MPEFERPKQVRKPGRKSPYITIVDTGLGIAVQNAIQGSAATWPCSDHPTEGTERPQFRPVA